MIEYIEELEPGETLIIDEIWLCGELFWSAKELDSKPPENGLG